MSREWSRLLFLGVVWGAAFLLIRIASPEFGPFGVAEGRIVIAGVVLLAVGRTEVLRLVARRPVDFIVLATTYSVVPFSLVAFATLSIAASTSSVLYATAPLFTAVIAALWLHQHVSLKKAVGIGIGLVGVGIALGPSAQITSPQTLMSVGAVLVAALSYAFAGLWTRRRLSDVRPTQIAAAQLAVGAVLLAPLAIATAPAAVPSPIAIGAVALLAVVSTAAAWPVYFGLLARCGATSASTVTFIVPAFGLLWGALLLGERIRLEVLLGFGAILVSLLLVLGVAMPERLRRFGRQLAAERAMWAGFGL